MFPSLVNCCTIDWFSEWPDDALEKVATKFLEDLDMDEETRTSCVQAWTNEHSNSFDMYLLKRLYHVTQMCVYFHKSVGDLSERFLRELKRHNYVTPTSYLALITTFKTLLKAKREEILGLKTRYEMGLGKPEFASSQVQENA